MSAPVYPSAPNPESSGYPGSDHYRYAPDVNAYGQHPYAPSSPKLRGERRRGRAGLIVLLALLFSLVGGLVGGGVGYFVASTRVPAATSALTTLSTLTGAPSAANPVPPAAAGSIAEVAAAVQPAVVQLNVKGDQQSGTGSGFVITADGYIVTNNHVAGAAGESGTIEVAFADGRTATGKLIGASPDYDLAVVKVDRDDLATVPLGRSAGLRVGDTVIALGSPLGLQGTVTTGIVSALNRPVTAGGEGETAYIDAIQTDAAINPGNSGGPLVDGSGAVVGVNSAIATMGNAAGQAGSIGLGFAIPIDTAKRVANEIITNGSAQTPVIGVRLDMQFTGPGAKVIEVTEGGPAKAAGLRVDDIILAVNGQQIADSTQAIVTIRANAPGDEVTLSIIRDGQPQDLRLTLQAAKPQ